jgi:type I restriction enzyme S subunit
MLVIRNFNIKNGRLNLNETSFTDELTFEDRIKRSRPTSGDLIITREAPMGEVCIIPKGINCCLGQRMVLIKPNKNKVDNKYLLYALQSEFVKKQIQVSDKTGSTVSNLRIPVLENLLIPCFNNIYEKNIGTILDNLDSKIELNNRINAELEGMAKMIYDYWFVQFDFHDANGKPYKTSGGKMVWNKELKREIPEGWGVQKMEEWLDFEKSGDWGKDEEEGNFTKKVICLRGADINGLNGQGELKPPTRYILEKNSSKILKSHDLIIEISGGSPSQSTGRLAFITDATIKRFEHPLICSNFCKPVSIRNKKLLYNFVYYWKSLYDNGIFFGYEGKTSGIKNLLLDSFLGSYYTLVPDEKIVNQFYDIMENIQEKKQTSLAENQKLTELRDWLLPMLMNGQVIVNENN